MVRRISEFPAERFAARFGLGHGFQNDGGLRRQNPLIFRQHLGAAGTAVARRFTRPDDFPFAPKGCSEEWNGSVAQVFTASQIHQKKAIVVVFSKIAKDETL